MSTIAKLADALDVTPVYLMGIGEEQLPADAIPLYAEQNIEGYTLTDLNGGAEYFALRVSGDSMNAIGINDGYLIIVLLSPPNSRTTAAHKKSPKALKTNAFGDFFIHSYQ